MWANNAHLSCNHDALQNSTLTIIFIPSTYLLFYFSCRYTHVLVTVVIAGSCSRAPRCCVCLAMLKKKKKNPTPQCVVVHWGYLTVKITSFNKTWSTLDEISFVANTRAWFALYFLFFVSFFRLRRKSPAESNIIFFLHQYRELKLGLIRFMRVYTYMIHKFIFIPQIESRKIVVDGTNIKSSGHV